MSAIEPPVCPICQRPVELESAKTDENGKAIHEDCYVSEVSRTATSTSLPDYSETLSMYERESRTAEAKVVERRADKRLTSA